MLVRINIEMILYDQHKKRSFNNSDLPYCVIVPVHSSSRLKRQRSTYKIDKKYSLFNALGQLIIGLGDI